MTASQAKLCLDQTTQFAACVACILGESLPDTRQIDDYYGQLIDSLNGRDYDVVTRAEVKGFMLSVARKSVELLEALA